MTKRRRTATILVLLIAAALAGAHLIVARNNVAMSGAPVETPTGVFH